MSEHAVSQELLQLKSLHGKPQLLVLGTVASQRLQTDREKQHQQQGLWSQLLSLSQRLIVATLTYSVSILVNLWNKVYDTAAVLIKGHGGGEAVPATRQRQD
jgi:hypothetical protein